MLYPEYIVLAHLPFTKDNGECEWVIFDGVHGKAMAEQAERKFRKDFREVQIREVL
jgi:hypothetical protein